MNRRDMLATIAVLLASRIAQDGRAETVSDSDTQTGASSKKSSTGRISRVFTGTDGRSHIEELELEEHEVRPGVIETQWIDATSVSLRFLEPGPEFVAQARHVAPRRQLAAILTGALELECSPSEVRRFGPGSVVLLEDTTGEGHITRVVESPASLVQIALKA